MKTRIFTKIDRERNMKRWYAISWGSTLFGRWVVARSWSRLGSDWAGRQVDEFGTEEDEDMIFTVDAIKVLAKNIVHTAMIVKAGGKQLSGMLKEDGGCDIFLRRLDSE